MSRTDIPVVERASVIEVFVNGIYRIDNLGPTFNVNYYVLQKDTCNGQLMRVPNLSITWAKEDFIAVAGIVREWLAGGDAALKGVPERRDMM